MDTNKTPSVMHELCIEHDGFLPAMKCKKKNWIMNSIENYTIAGTFMAVYRETIYKCEIYTYV